ncbi:MAG: S9 family peptidase [Pseudomonadales bacterium]
MRNWIVIAALLLTLWALAARLSRPPEDSYVTNDLSSAPVAERTMRSSTHHGITIDDPYGWLKDDGYPTVDDPEVLAYLQAENAWYEQHMAPLQPLVDTLFAEIKGRQPEEDAAVPWLENGYWYQWRFNRGAQYRTWYWAPASDPDNFSVLLDEQELAEGHDYFRLGGLEVSPDHRLLAYSTDTNGSERYTMVVQDLASGTQLVSAIADTAGEPIFSADSQQLFYRLVNADWRPYQVLRQDLTETSNAPQVVFEESDPSFFVGMEVTQSDDYLIVSSADHVTSESWLLPLATADGPLTLVSPRRAGHEYDIEHRGELLLIRSNRAHKNFGLYEAPLAAPEESNWREVIAGSDTTYLTGHVAFSTLTVLTERVNGLDQIQVLATDGTSHHIEFPEASYAAGLGTNAEFDIAALRVHYESMVTPDTVYDYDLQTRTLVTRKVTQIPSGYSQDNYRTERLELTVRDGVSVPVSLVYHKDSPPSSTRPLYLYGYGAYGIAIEPGFSSSRLSLLDRGVSFAIAHIRGGDDLGYGWYEAGKLQQRTNTFNDFVDVAEALIARDYTGSGRIAMVGGSAGGELVGAAVNQARDLLGAAVLHVPFVDVLNTMLDTSLPLTPMEWPEWGNPIEDAEAFRFIQSYSPYDQLAAGAYPPMLVTGGLNDPRVTYWEPAKYVAKLRTLKTDNEPLLLKINMGAGHGGQSGRFNALRETAEEYTFILTSLQVDGLQ